MHEAQSADHTVMDVGGENYRSSDLFWLKHNDMSARWVFDRLRDFVVDWNAKTYAFEIEECSDLQLTHYKVGQHYDWHADLGHSLYSRRKISLAVMLSEPASHEGGHLEFFSSDTRRPRPIVKQGDVVVFPAWMKHRVTPVTRGERWSLIGWWSGPPFR